jgi:hypothetical protein
MADATPPPLPEAEQVVVVNPRSKRNLTADEVKQVIAALLVGCSWDDDRQPILWRGIFKEVGLRLEMSRTQLHRIWKRAKTNFEDPNINEERKQRPASFVRSGRTACCHRGSS